MISIEQFGIKSIVFRLYNTTIRLLSRLPFCLAERYPEEFARQLLPVGDRDLFLALTGTLLRERKSEREHSTAVTPSVCTVRMRKKKPYFFNDRGRKVVSTNLSPPNWELVCDLEQIFRPSLLFVLDRLDG